MQEDAITNEVLGKIRLLHDIATQRGQSLAQLALAWLLKDPRVTSVLIGASSVHQLEQNLACQAQGDISTEELAAVEDVLRS